MMVMTQLKKLNLHFSEVKLGSVEIIEDITPEQREQLKINLKKSGLELLGDKHSVLVENIITVINEMIHYTDDEPKANYSDHISEKLGYDYTYLTNIFAEVKGITIQHYIILNKIEKVKELILYEDLTLTEIAARMYYSSVGHLSNQFKKITGHTPTFYKDLAHKRRENLDNV